MTAPTSLTCTCGRPRVRSRTTGRLRRSCATCIRRSARHAGARKRANDRRAGVAARQANPAAYARWNRKHRTGWTQEMVDAAWKRQGGRCVECRRPMLPKGKASQSVRCERGSPDLHCLGCYSVRSGMATRKLTDRQVADIHSSKGSAAVVARRNGCSASYVAALRAGRYIRSHETPPRKQASQ